MKALKKLLNDTACKRAAAMAAIALTAAFTLSACDRNEGPMEEAGESIDQSFENAQEHYREGVEEVKDEYDDHTTN